MARRGPSGTRGSYGRTMSVTPDDMQRMVEAGTLSSTHDRERRWCGWCALVFAVVVVVALLVWVVVAVATDGSDSSSRAAHAGVYTATTGVGGLGGTLGTNPVSTWNPLSSDGAPATVTPSGLIPNTNDSYWNAITLLMTYRTGAYRPAGTQYADTMQAVNGQYNQARLLDLPPTSSFMLVVECEYGYSTPVGLACYVNNMALAPVFILPLSTGLSAALHKAPSLTSSTVLSNGYGSQYTSVVSTDVAESSVWHLAPDYVAAFQAFLEWVESRTDATSATSARLGLLYHDSAYGATIHSRWGLYCRASGFIDSQNNTFAVPHSTIANRTALEPIVRRALASGATTLLTMPWGTMQENILEVVNAILNEQDTGAQSGTTGTVQVVAMWWGAEGLEAFWNERTTPPNPRLETYVLSFVNPQHYKPITTLGASIAVETSASFATIQNTLLRAMAVRDRIVIGELCYNAHITNEFELKHWNGTSGNSVYASMSPAPTFGGRTCSASVVHRMLRGDFGSLTINFGAVSSAEGQFSGDCRVDPQTHGCTSNVVYVLKANSTGPVGFHYTLVYNASIPTTSSETNTDPDALLQLPSNMQKAIDASADPEVVVMPDDVSATSQPIVMDALKTLAAW